MIAIVSGLPRSGTSLMMQMLAAGGLPVVADDARTPDAHNPRGYLEDRRVKSLESDSSWLAEADGRALKVVSLLLYALPRDFQYRVVFMHRDLDEVLRSQRSMLDEVSVEFAELEMRAHFWQHLAALHDWIPQQDHLDLLQVDYGEVIADPHAAAATVANFLQLELDVAAMAAAVDPSLYRQRNSD